MTSFSTVRTRLCNELVGNHPLSLPMMRVFSNVISCINEKKCPFRVSLKTFRSSRDSRQQNSFPRSAAVFFLVFLFHVGLRWMKEKKNNNAVRLFCIVVLDVVVSVNAARFYFCQDAYNLKVTVILYSGLLPQSHWFFFVNSKPVKRPPSSAERLFNFCSFATRDLDG